MKDRKYDKYAVENQKWINYCIKSNCTKATILCKSCGYNGHKVEWLDSGTVLPASEKFPDDGLCFRVHVFIAHAHFVEDQDRGRHVMHKIKETSIPIKFCTKIWVLKKRKLPNHVREILDGEN